jgi:deoxyhypusine synthase
MIDCIVATGASIVDMDFLRRPRLQALPGRSQVDDRELRDLYIDRIYDTYIDEEDLQACDHTIYEIANSLEPRPYSAASSSRRWASGSTKNGKKKNSS